MREPLSHDQMLYICRMSEEGGVGVPERGLLKGELWSVAKVDSLSSRKFDWSGLSDSASLPLLRNGVSCTVRVRNHERRMTDEKGPITSRLGRRQGDNESRQHRM